MTNPFAAHRSDLFADRETIDEALKYANTIILDALEGSDKAAAMTAVMVLVNTAAKLWPQPVQADPARALLADMVRQMVEQHLEETATDLEEKIEDGVQTWMDRNLEDKISSEVEDFIKNSVTISIDTI
jgi:uncharacterized membrane-anchored protein YjiN (DUF445 family)